MRSTMLSIVFGKPGSTKPVLRPEAAQATRFDSSTATDQPRRATSRATVKPASPAPTTQTSTSRSKASRGRSGLATRVASYQPAAVFSPSLMACCPLAAALRWPRARMLNCRRFEIDAFRADQRLPHYPDTTTMRRLLLFRHAKADRAEPGEKTWRAC